LPIASQFPFLSSLQACSFGSLPSAYALGCNLSPLGGFPTYLLYPLNTIAGSKLVTLLMETSAAPTHMASVKKNIPIAIGKGSRIAAPPLWLALTTKALTIMPSTYPITALIAACLMITL